MEGVSIKEAAARLGLSEKTVRKSIKAGAIRADRVETPQGYTYCVYLEDTPPPDSQVEPDLVKQVEAPATVDASAHLEALRMIDKLQAENRDLAGQLGWHMSQLQVAQDRIKQLEAPQDEPEQTRRSWWRRLLGR